MPPGPVHSGPRPVILELEVWARTSAGEPIPNRAAPAPTSVPPTKSRRVMSAVDALVSGPMFETLYFGHVTNKLAATWGASQATRDNQALGALRSSTRRALPAERSRALGSRTCTITLTPMLFLMRPPKSADARCRSSDAPEISALHST